MLKARLPIRSKIYLYNLFFFLSDLTVTSSGKLIGEILSDVNFLLFCFSVLF